MTKGKQGYVISPLCGKLAATLTAVFVVALGSNAMAGPSPIQPPSAVPEAGSWLIGAGVLGMLGFEFLRRRSVLKAQQAPD